MQDIRLYIGEMEVEFKDTPEILYNWTETDLTNPTLTKNGYSKTITVEGTPNNNKIFGHFWNIERYQFGTSNNGPGFNPSYRVPFTLYYNGNVFESGYIKLQNVKIENGIIYYEIGLFGGLGSFLYNLSVDWNTGEKKTLASLQYYANPDGLINYYEQDWGAYETDLGFTINKETVNEAWHMGLWPQVHYKWEIINFAPCYNGISENLSSDKAIMTFNGYQSTSEDSPITPSAKTVDAKSYYIKDGYSLATLPRKMNEWEMKDLRSWCQRPVISTKGILAALFSKKNNKGEYDNGYEVYIDPAFKENNYDPNPYYSDTWMTLPLLSSLEFNTSEDYSIPLTSNWTGYYKVGEGNYTYVFNLPSAVTEYGVSAKLKFNLRVNCNSSSNNLYSSYGYLKNPNPFNLKVETMVNAIGIQAYTSDDDSNAGAVLGNSDIQWLWLPAEDSNIPPSVPSNIKKKVMGFFTNPTYESCVKKGVYTPIVSDVAVNSNKGYWMKVGNGIYEWSSPVELNCSLPPGSSYLKINLQRCGTKNKSYSSSSSWINTLVNDTFFSSAPTKYSSGFDIVNKTTFAERNFALNYPSQNNFFSNKVITQEQLLSTDYTPADWLMAYCKTFGLYIWKEVDKDIIHIDTRNTFYNRNVIKDISDQIDYSKELTIKPIAVDAGYYEMKNQSCEGAAFKDYLEKYGKDYGMKIIDTGYEFDAETKPLINIPFKSAVQVRDNSQFYFNKWNTGEQPFFFGGMSYKLWTRGSGTVETYDWEIPQRVISTACTPFDMDYMFFDSFDKPQFCDADNKPLDGANVLLFNWGTFQCLGMGYMLTDDLNKMAELNNNPCYIIAPSSADSAGVEVGIPLDTIPTYSRYRSNYNLIATSLDWGNPRELYDPKLYIREDNTLYKNYYDKYLSDLYDINTRVLTCFIKADKIINQEDLRNFYWFRNGIWRLNKVIDYNPASNNSVKCEFIKVQDLDNMTNSIVGSRNELLYESLTPNTMPSYGGTALLEFRTRDGSGCSIEIEGDITIEGWSSGLARDGAYNVVVGPNTSSTIEHPYIVLFPDPDGYGSATLYIEQAASGPYFNLSTNSMSFVSEGDAAPLTITTNTSWRVVSKPSWVNIGTTSGTTTTITTVTAEANSGSSRSGVITFNADDLGNYTLNVEQQAMPVWSCFFNITYGDVTVPQTGTWDDYVLYWNYDQNVIENGQRLVEYECSQALYSYSTWNPISYVSYDTYTPFGEVDWNLFSVPSSFAGQTIYLQAEFGSSYLGQAVQSYVVPVTIPESGGMINIVIPQM